MMSQNLAAILLDPAAAAQEAQLRYVGLDEAGFIRRRCGRGFVILTPDGTPLRHPKHLARIQALAIPPAWTHVWICTTADGHIQATGRDERGRKQYIYHARWRLVRDAAKFDHLLTFGKVLPKLRGQIRRDLSLRGLPRPKVLAAVARLLDRTYARIGNAEYVQANGSYGLTTLCSRHVDVSGSLIRISFRGKGGRKHSLSLDSPRLARVVASCQELPGQRLFRYLDRDGVPQAVESGDVNEYLRGIAGVPVTAKEFRTWGATVTAAVTLEAAGECQSLTAARRSVSAAMVRASEVLGNTPAICRKSYVHPGLVQAFLEGRLCRELAECRKLARYRVRRDFQLEEAMVLAFLERCPVVVP